MLCYGRLVVDIYVALWLLNPTESGNYFNERKSMKNTFYLVVFILVLLSSKNVIAQSNCYNNLKTKIEQSDGYISDGNHNEVIVSFRTRNSTKCYDGKCTVKNGVITVLLHG